MFFALLLVGLIQFVACYNDPNYAPGHDVMVHLFEWKWNDIAVECERFLSPMGFGGVQVSPIQENVIVPNRPWWERYQPLSYEWDTRSGSEVEFRDMVRRCNAVGVRIYVDAILNHMSADQPNERIAHGTAGSTALTNEREYYAVPYNRSHFHESCSINNYNDPVEVRMCEVVGLHDLDQSNPYVVEKIVDFMNKAINAGVAGFRIDAAKHIWPQDLQVIYSKLDDLNSSHGFQSNSRPYIFQEVIDFGSEAIKKYDYSHLAAVTEFRYGMELRKALSGNNPLKWLVSWGEDWGLLPSKDSLVFVDNHDNQRNNEDNTLTYKNSKLYKMAVAFMLAHPYGTPRVMSSFDFKTFDQPPPADSEGRLISPGINDDDTCSNGWICEHRWRQIYNMVRFRNAANGSALTDWWDNGNNQIAFCRGNSGFLAINADSCDLHQRLKTCLPAGSYCDVITGNLINNSCTGKTIDVDENGYANVWITTGEEDGVLALHIGAKIQR